MQKSSLVLTLSPGAIIAFIVLVVPAATFIWWGNSKAGTANRPTTKASPNVSVSRAVSVDDAEADLTNAMTAPRGEEIAPLPPETGTVTLEHGEEKLRTHETGMLEVKAVRGGARIHVRQANPQQWWIAQAYCTYPPAIRLGETLYLHLRARSRTHNPVWVILEEGPSPYRKNFAHHLELTSDWKDYAFRIPVKVEDKEQNSRVRLQLGEKEGDIEVGLLEMRRL